MMRAYEDKLSYGWMDDEWKLVDGAEKGDTLWFGKRGRMLRVDDSGRGF